MGPPVHFPCRVLVTVTQLSGAEVTVVKGAQGPRRREEDWGPKDTEGTQGTQLPLRRPRAVRAASSGGEQVPWLGRKGLTVTPVNRAELTPTPAICQLSPVPQAIPVSVEIVCL